MSKDLNLDEDFEEFKEAIKKALKSTFWAVFVFCLAVILAMAGYSIGPVISKFMMDFTESFPLIAWGIAIFSLIGWVFLFLLFCYLGQIEIQKERR